MRSFLLVAACVSLLWASAVIALGSTPSPAASDDWGSRLPWVGLKEGLIQARAEGKIVMVLIHSPWCKACTALQESMQKEQDGLLAQSEGMVMVKLSSKDEPAAKQFRLDGTYVPRLYYLQPDGQIMKGAYNIQGNPKFKYFYPSAYFVTQSMGFAKHIYAKITGHKVPTTNTKPVAPTAATHTLTQATVHTTTRTKTIEITKKSKKRKTTQEQKTKAKTKKTKKKKKKTKKTKKEKKKKTKKKKKKTKKKPIVQDEDEDESYASYRDEL